MNWPYIHTLVNHFPIILMVVGSAVLILALITGRRGIWLYALATLTLAGLSIWPADFTGDQAADVMRQAWYVVPAAIEEHDDAATFALIFTLLVGAVAAYAWWRMLRREPNALPPKWLRVVVLVLALFDLTVVTRVAYLGGKIVHDSPKLLTPPPGVVIDTAGRGAE